MTDTPQRDDTETLRAENIVLRDQLQRLVEQAEENGRVVDDVHIRQAKSVEAVVAAIALLTSWRNQVESLKAELTLLRQQVGGAFEAIQRAGLKQCSPDLPTAVAEALRVQR